MSAASPAEVPQGARSMLRAIRDKERLVADRLEAARAATRARSQAARDEAHALLREARERAAQAAREYVRREVAAAGDEAERIRAAGLDAARETAARFAALKERAVERILEVVLPRDARPAEGSP